MFIVGRVRYQPWPHQSNFDHTLPALSTSGICLQWDMHVFTVRLATFTVRRVYVCTCEHALGKRHSCVAFWASDAWHTCIYTISLLRKKKYLSCLRFITAGNLGNYIVNNTAQPFRYDQAYGLSQELTENVSDHYPIEVLLQGMYPVMWSSCDHHVIRSWQLETSITSLKPYSCTVEPLNADTFGTSEKWSD